ncbi:MAG TPA: hypothetical protein VN193_11865 [Candidatus Angelobacter sp.]|jgi:hypothetical protein|nr:hypothetical protein [Candidatus Angelobacter sp.]
MNNLTRYGGNLPRPVRQELSNVHYDGLVTAHKMQTHAAAGHLGMTVVSALSHSEAALMRACPRGAARIEAVCEVTCEAIRTELIRLALR